jgi:prepilin-type N-terminal cleavage/methylation domain-containing protein
VWHGFRLLFGRNECLHVHVGGWRVFAGFIQAIVSHWTVKGAMMTKKQPFKPSTCRNQGYTLVEVMVSVGILAIMMLSLYAAFNSGFGSIAVTREEMRATQIMTQKLEAIRLLTWAQLSNCPTAFQEYYNPQGATNNTEGTMYYGTLSTHGTATNLPNSVAYKANVHLITVTVTWTNNFSGNAPIGHTRMMQTLAADNGLQKYIFGKTQ